MNVVIILFLILILLFGFVVLFGAPYLPTLTRQTEAAFELLDLKPGQTLIELGSGDGKVLVAAAKRGISAVGYELNPLLVLISIGMTWRYRDKVKVIWGNFWWHKWPEADAIFTFLLPRYMKKLDKKITQYKHKPVKLVSFAFSIPGKKVVAQREGLFVYEYE